MTGCTIMKGFDETEESKEPITSTQWKISLN